MREIEASDDDVIVIRKKKDDSLSKLQMMMMKDMMSAIKNQETAIVSAINNQKMKVNVNVRPPEINIPKQKQINLNGMFEKLKETLMQKPQVIVKKSGSIDYNKLSKLYSKQFEMMLKELKKKKQGSKTIVVSKESKATPMG
jgi:hypothetical protein